MSQEDASTATDTVGAILSMQEAAAEANGGGTAATKLLGLYGKGISGTGVALNAHNAPDGAKAIVMVAGATGMYVEDTSMNVLGRAAMMAPSWWKLPAYGLAMAASWKLGNVAEEKVYDYYSATNS